MADITVYFYTYSTIAQTLAGAFGFLVAVILYLIQGISTRPLWPTARPTATG